MESREIIEKMEKEDRLLSESAVMKAVQKALIEMGYEPLDERVMGVYKSIENVQTANDWISCSSGKLPVGEEFELYDSEEDITYHKHVYVNTDNVNIPYCTAYYDTDCWFDAVTNIPINVVAWKEISPYVPSVN